MTTGVTFIREIFLRRIFLKYFTKAYCDSWIDGQDYNKKGRCDDQLAAVHTFSTKMAQDLVNLRLEQPKVTFMTLVLRPVNTSDANSWTLNQVY